MKLIFTTMLIFVSIFLFAQKKNLKIDDRAVSNLLLWFDKPNEISTEDLSSLPANLLMEAIYMDHHGNPPTFKNCLQSFLSNDTLSIHYGLKKAYKNRVQIKNLFELIQKADFNQSLQSLTPYFSKSDLENVNCQVY